MSWRMIIAAIVTVLLSACGAGKSATSTSGAGGTDGQEQPVLTKAEIDTLQHEAARLAMEQGEFVFMVSRIFYDGKNISTTPGPNYLEVTGNKLFFQEDCLPGKQPRRTATKISKMTFADDAGQFKMAIATSSLHCPFFNVYLTLYSGGNKAWGMLDSWIGIEGYILPRKVARISKSAPPSRTETVESW